MKNSKIRNSKPLSLVLGVLLGLLGLLLVFHIFSFTSVSHRLFAKRVQKIIYHEDDILQQSKVDLLYAFDKWNYTGAFRVLEYKKLPDIGVYVFKKDSLLFWNTNVIEPKLLRKRVDVGNNTIVNLNCGDYLVSSLAYGSYSFYLFSLLNTTYPVENKYFVNKFQPILGKHLVYFSNENKPNSYPVYSRSGELLAYCSIHFPSTRSSSNLQLLVLCAMLMLLCFYLLCTRYFITKHRFRMAKKLTKKKQPVLLVIAILTFVTISFFSFRQLFRYAFNQGFFIPSAISLDYCFLGLFIGVLVLISFSMLFLYLLKPWLKERNEFLLMIAELVFCGFLLTVLYNKEYTRFENRKIQTLAKELSNERDEAFELSYQKFLSDSQQDTVFSKMAFSDDVMEEVLLDYMRSFLLDSVMNQYNLSLTRCSAGQELFVRPFDIVSDCQQYFSEKVTANQGQELGEGLYFMDYNALDPNYLALLSQKTTDTLKQKTLYLEFSKPIAPQNFGLPKMLHDNHSELLMNSSVACYRDSLLVYKVGSYIYPNFLSDYDHPANGFSYSKKTKHYVYQIDDSKVLAISTERRGLMETTAPFVVFFFLLLVLYLLVYFVGGVRRSNPAPQTLSNRFQMIVLVALGISFLLIGPISVIYIRSLYTQKVNENLFERTRTLSLDITGEVDFSFLKQPGFKNLLDEILRRYSETFFTDINVYDINGKLMATTSPEIQELQIMTTLMDAEAFQNMQGEKSLYYIHEERIGKAVYQSSYISIQDGAGKTLAYLNIPYFTSQSDFENEILYYILTYVNIILLIIFVFLPVVLIITRRTTDPLVRLQEKMRQVDINKSNEKLEWKSNDEIGDLINQYNQLVVELEKSANELRRTTTESAWRGVARQVAHEIKNSLTPMRLSVQLLQRNVENGNVTQEQIQRTTNTLIEQIDALSDIASSFSRYAKLPENHPQPLDLSELVGNLVNLYDNAENIAFQYHYDPSADHTFNSDKTNLNSAIGNIIKNATQAIAPGQEGRIEVSLRRTDAAFVITVKDNGKGIKEEDKKMIFVPNFTTKTGGSGVGLSLAYNNIKSAGGNIRFESQEGKGAEFIIELPRV